MNMNDGWYKNGSMFNVADGLIILMLFLTLTDIGNDNNAFPLTDNHDELLKKECSFSTFTVYCK